MAERKRFGGDRGDLVAQAGAARTRGRRSEPTLDAKLSKWQCQGQEYLIEIADLPIENSQTDSE